MIGPWWFGALCAGVMGVAGSQEESPPASGLMATFEGGGAVDTRVVRLGTMRVDPGEAPSAFVPPGPFSATFRGTLNLKLRSRLQFRVAGRGHVVLSIGGEVILESVGEDLSVVQTEVARFSKGANELTLQYRSPDDGVAWLRLEWAGQSFEWEPVPPAVLRHASDDAALQVGQSRRAGREAFAQARCVQCHEVSSAQAMPELAMDAPDLRGTGARLRAGWLAQWILDPQSLRPQASMPRIVDHASLDAARAAGDTTVDDLVAFLSADGEASDDVAPSAESVAEGGALFAELGCVACHTLPDSAVEDAVRLPLARTAAKWHRAALEAFLKAPHSRYAWVRMPDFGLSDEEATALSSYLLDASMASRDAADDAVRGDAQRGREAFAALGCAECHEAGVDSTMTAPAWNGAVDGCVLGEGNGPAYDFDADERSALAAFAETGTASLAHANASEFAARQIESLQCVACHTFGDMHDRWEGLAAETKTLERVREHAEIDQRRPALTWVGEKLHTPEVLGLLSGSLERRTRPWLAARMPAFPSRAELLTQGLASQHGMGPSEPVEVALDEESRDLGAELLGPLGFACDSCHPVAGTPARLKLEFETPNLDLTHERIRPAYYARWMFNPMRVEPGSNMPRFADSKGGSPFTEWYDGDIRAQYEAIRRYLASIQR